MEDDPSNEVVCYPSFPRDISLSRYEDSSLCVIGTQDYWELGMINPSPFPVYFGLSCSEPLIAEDCFLFPKFCEIEPKVGIVGSCLNLEIGIEAELSTFVFRPVDIQQFSRFIHLFNGKL